MMHFCKELLPCFTEHVKKVIFLRKRSHILPQFEGLLCGMSPEIIDRLKEIFLGECSIGAGKNSLVLMNDLIHVVNTLYSV